MPTEEQYKQRIEALEARVAELTLHLERVARELEEANAKLESRDPESPPPSAPQRLDTPAPGSVCTFCDGEGIYWVHDFEMVCRRCNGTGYAPGEPASTEPAEAP
jgi:hypothetical protein